MSILNKIIACSGGYWDPVFGVSPSRLYLTEKGMQLIAEKYGMPQELVRKFAFHHSFNERFTTQKTRSSILHTKFKNFLE